ncbi:phage antirepressor KilAC domain-containing protein [Comamonas kerstersii]|uniref:phage antirepressor KilAC domain-containing protein n=1 Tax=Comamonas kerstersii TaxID=225992 RepID=UPI00345D9C46
MNKLMTMAQVATLTMSSREIAGLTGKRHDNVMVLCRSLRDMGVCPEIQETPYVNEQNGQTYLECRLGKRDSLVLIARISPEFTAAVVDRWQELEAQQSPKVPQTYAQALLEAGRLAQLAEEQAQQLALAAPKVEFVERFVQSSSGSKGFREVCKLLKANEAEFRAFVMDRRIMYRLGGKLTAYQCHIDAGRFEVRAGVTESEHAYTTTKFTAKGVCWIAGEWAKYQVEQQVAA